MRVMDTRLRAMAAGGRAVFDAKAATVTMTLPVEHGCLALFAADFGHVGIHIEQAAIRRDITRVGSGADVLQRIGIEHHEVCALAAFQLAEVA